MTELELFGTTEPPFARRILRAGDLSAVLEDGNLRTIRFRGVEVLRAINYLARDSDWGTYAPLISDLRVEETPTRFRVTYHALCSGSEGRFAYDMAITGEAEGRITVRVQGGAVTDFPTNRTGFVLLHPSEAAGLDLLIETPDGLQVTRFPDTIDPDSPATGIQAMTHHPAGLTVRVAMEGDLFEMEDQRNWADASFKTYIRPLSKPRPYVIAKGAEDAQSITVTVGGAPEAAGIATQTFVIGPAIGKMPSMALFVDRPEASGPFPAGIAQYLILRWRLGDLPEALTRAAAMNAELAIEAILPAISPDTEALALMKALGAVQPQVLLLAPAREFKTSATNSLPAGQVSVDALVQALRRAGYTGKIVAGTPSFFTEFNRNPPGNAADAVYFGGCGIVHAADDLSVMETLTAYPAILTSAAARTGNRPLWLGPCTLGARHAPYGASVMPNPQNLRIPMAQDDPRHKALFAAAYAVGLMAATAGSSVECLTLAAPAGPFGLSGPDGARYPLYAVQAVLAGGAGSTRRGVTMPGLAAVAWEQGDQLQILISNTAPDSTILTLPPDASLRFLTPTADWGAPQTGTVTIGPYRSALLTYSSARER